MVPKLRRCNDARLDKRSACVVTPPPRISPSSARRNFLSTIGLFSSFLCLFVVFCTSVLSGCFGLVGGTEIDGSGGKFEGPLTATNTDPLLIVSGYATHLNGMYDPSRPDDINWWEGWQNIEMVWNSIPDSLKPYSCFSFHTNFIVGSRRGTYGSYAGDDALKRWFEDQIKICQRNKIPVVPVVWSAWPDWYAFNEIDPSKTEWRQWLEYMVKTYSCIKGFVSTENHHTTVENNVPRFNSWLEFCDQYDLKFIIGDSANSIYKYTTDPTFVEAVKKYGKDHLIMNVKDTKPLRWAIGYSYMQGLWLNDQNYAYGALIDTWTWNLRGQTKLGSTANNQSESVRQALIYPEGLLHNYLMTQYINGATIFNFEIPWQVYGIKGKTSEVMANVIAPFFQWMVENPAPSKDEILEMTKYVFHGDGMAEGANNYEKLYPDGMLLGLVRELHKTGRYGLVPGLLQELEPNGGLKSAIDGGRIEKFDGTPNMNSDNLIAQNLWEEKYPDKSLNSTLGSGKTPAFVAHRNTSGTGNKDTWYLYNYIFNDAGAFTPGNESLQYAKIPLGGISSGKSLEIAMTPHTGVIVKEVEAGKIEVSMSNYRLNKDHVMDGPPNGIVAGGVYIGGSPLAAYTWIEDNMTSGGINVPANIANGIRNTVFTFSGVEYFSPKITQNQENSPSTLNPRASDKSITVTGNGWIRFEVSYQ